MPHLIDVVTRRRRGKAGRMDESTASRRAARALVACRWRAARIRRDKPELGRLSSSPRDVVTLLMTTRPEDGGAMNRVRPALMADAASIARIDVDSWRSTYAGVLPDKLLLALSESERRRSWASYAARHPGDLIVGSDAGGRVQGFGNCGPARDPSGRFAGEVFTLYVAVDHQGKGLGRALLLALFARLLRRQLGSAVVWVLRDNPSRFFYERLGGKLVGHRPILLSGATVAASAYGWQDLTAVLKAQARTGDGLPGGG